MFMDRKNQYSENEYTTQSNILTSYSIPLMNIPQLVFQFPTNNQLLLFSTHFKIYYKQYCKKHFSVDISRGNVGEFFWVDSNVE